MPFKRRRNAAAAAGIGSQTGHRHARCHCHGSASAATAGDVEGVVGIGHDAESCILAGDAERQFVHIGFTQHDGAGCLEARHHRSVSLGDERLQKRRPCSIRQPRYVNVVLDRDRNALQRSVPLPAQALLVRFPRLFQGSVVIHENEGVQLLMPGSGVQCLCGEVFAGDLTVRHHSLQRRNGLLRKGGGHRRLHSGACERQKQNAAAKKLLFHDAPKLASGGPKKNHQN